MLLLEIGDIDRRIAAGESLARDRFDSDYVLGTQLESRTPDQLGSTLFGSGSICGWRQMAILTN